MVVMEIYLQLTFIALCLPNTFFRCYYNFSKITKCQYIPSPQNQRRAKQNQSGKKR